MPKLVQLSHRSPLTQVLTKSQRQSCGTWHTEHCDRLKEGAARLTQQSLSGFFLRFLYSSLSHPQSMELVFWLKRQSTKQNESSLRHIFFDQFSLLIQMLTAKPELLYSRCHGRAYSAVHPSWSDPHASDLVWFDSSHNPTVAKWQSCSVWCRLWQAC